MSFFVCEPLKKAGFINAFGTRAYRADNPQPFLCAIGAAEWELKLAKQIHSDIRLDVDNNQLIEGDALITARARTLVGIKTADCLPILIGDPKSGRAVAVHAGWRGTLARIVEKTIHDLTKKWAIVPSECVAALGPAACGDCYQVGEDVIAPFKEKFFDWPSFLTNFSHGKAHFDGAAANRNQLLAAGLQARHIHHVSYCTMHQNDLFFSHRRGDGDGRLLSVIGKQSKDPHGQN